MKIVSERIMLDTSGNGDFLDITDNVARSLAKSGLRAGYVLVFVAGSTAGITTFEYEPGLVADLKEFLQRMAPTGKHYHHDDTWGDANGFSHVRASSLAPRLPCLSRGQTCSWARGSRSCSRNSTTGLDTERSSCRSSGNDHFSKPGSPISKLRGGLSRTDAG